MAVNRSHIERYAMQWINYPGMADKWIALRIPGAEEEECNNLRKSWRELEHILANRERWRVGLTDAKRHSEVTGSHI